MNLSGPGDLCGNIFSYKLDFLVDMKLFMLSHFLSNLFQKTCPISSQELNLLA